MAIEDIVCLGVCFQSTMGKRRHKCSPIALPSSQRAYFEDGKSSIPGLSSRRWVFEDKFSFTALPNYLQNLAQSV